MDADSESPMWFSLALLEKSHLLQNPPCLSMEGMKFARMIIGGSVLPSVCACAREVHCTGWRRNTCVAPDGKY